MVAYITYWVTIVEEPKSYFIIKLIGNRFAKQGQNCLLER